METLDKQLLRLIQDGIPLVKRPFEVIADELNISEKKVIDQIAQMKERGWIRRIGCVPHHYNLGITANGMTAWDVPNDKVDRVGAKFGQFNFVSHCYRRPRHEPIWPYNLFAMVHGRNKREVFDKLKKLEAVIDIEGVKKEVLFSTKLLKKQGSRFSDDSSCP